MTRYPASNTDLSQASVPGEHCLFMSSKWNEEYVAKYFTGNKACKGLVLSSLFLSAFQNKNIRMARQPN